MKEESTHVLESSDREIERPDRQPAPIRSSPLDVHAIREHFLFPGVGRIATNNAASTQPPRELLELHSALALQYENVHRGQSSASQCTTRRFEAAYDDIARFVGRPAATASCWCAIRPRRSTR